MTKLLFTWAAIALVSVCHAQTLTVKDAESGTPMVGATLQGESGGFSITNSQGKADISMLKEATKIQIQSLGYKTAIKSFEELKAAGFMLLLEPSNLSLDEVVVSATRWGQYSSDVPSEIISISSKEATLQNPQTAADLLAISGKVFIQKSQQGGGSPMIRGFATNRLLYSVDGVRMNNAIFRAGNIQNVINIDPFATEKTEVFFGPGSVIYGSDAIGGVMSFQTLTPQFSLDEKVLVSGGALTRYSSANGEKTAHFDVRLGWKRWAAVTSFSTWDYDHLRQGAHGPTDYLKPYYVKRQDSVDLVISQRDALLQIPSAYSQINLMQKVRFAPSENLDFQYGFHLSETSPYGRYDRHNRVRNGTARYAEWHYGPQKWLMHNLSTTHSGGNVVYDQVTLRLALQRFDESRIDRALNSDERNTQTEKVLAYSANLDFVKTAREKNKVFYGVEYVLNDITSTGVLTDISTGLVQVGSSRYPQSTWSSMAAYLNDEFRATDQLTLQAGLRYSHYLLNADFSNNLAFYPFPFTKAKLDNGSLTGSIGGVYRPSDSWVINANFGTAFRSPNVDDLGKVFDSEPGTVTVPNPNLREEYAYNFDLGVAKVFDDVVKLDVTGYYTVLQNALVRRDYQLNGVDSILYLGEQAKVQAIQNAAVANVYGLQSGLEVKLPAGFTLSSDLNYQVGKEELDNGDTSPSRHAAPLFGASRLSLTAGKLRMQVNAQYQAKKGYNDLPREEQFKDEIYAKDANGQNYAPAWYTLNIKAMYTLSEIFTLNAGVENLTDQRFRPFSSGISGAGRNVVFSLKASF